MSRISAFAIAIAAATSAPAMAQFLEADVMVHLNLVGEAAGDSFGWVARSVGDINHDQCDDFIVSSIFNTEGGANAGKIYVYSGKDGAELFTDIGQNLWRLGFAVEGAGDVNNDGTPDIIVGAPYPVATAGRAIVYSGVDGSIIHTIDGEAAADQFGYSVGPAGDVNGDGFDDVLVGGPGHDANGFNAGRTYIISGADKSILEFVDGDAANDNLGASVDMAGDLNQDGIPDFVTAAMGASGGVGRVYAYSTGPDTPRIRTFVADGPAAMLGQWFIDGLGDVNGDGAPDVYASSYATSHAYVWSGADESVIWRLTGPAGYGIGKGLGDIDGDACVDLVMAAWVSPTGAPQAGQAFVLSGRNASNIRTITHTVPMAQFGFDAASAGDANGDGIVDYLITAANDNSATGRTFVILGAPAPHIADLNGDGVVDGADLATLLTLWNTSGGAAGADITGDGVVNGADLAFLLSNWG